MEVERIGWEVNHMRVSQGEQKEQQRERKDESSDQRREGIDEQVLTTPQRQRLK